MMEKSEPERDEPVLEEVGGENGGGSPAQVQKSKRAREGPF